jgi:hypothetical protein
MRCKPDMLNHVAAVFCFAVGVALMALASWLFAEGEIPAFPLGGGRYVAFGGASINGFDLPEWTFYFLPGGLYLVSVVFLWLVWHLLRLKHDPPSGAWNGGQGVQAA